MIFLNLKIDKEWVRWSGEIILSLNVTCSPISMDTSNIIISLLRANDKKHVWRGLDQSVLTPSGFVTWRKLFSSSDGLWWLLPGIWGLRILIYETCISEENVINIISPILLNKLLTRVLSSILTWVNKQREAGENICFVNKIQGFRNPCF